jgi:glycosyltransferase involved in cell wall biosynthesis
MQKTGMKVAIYVSELDVKGGTHKQVLRLAQYLKNQGHEIHLVTSCYVPGIGYPELNEFAILSISGPSVNGLFWKVYSVVKSLRLAVKLPQVDIINLHDNRCIAFGLACKILGKGKKCVWQINDLHPAFGIGAHCNQSPKKLKEKLICYANQLLAKCVDQITVNVGKNQSRAKEHLHRHALLMYCGVDFPSVNFTPLLPGEPFRLLSIGVFFSYRNYETLVDGCALANQRLSVPLELTIVGDTRYEPGYVKKIRERASLRAVSLTIREGLSQEELDQQIAGSHAFAFINVDQSWGLSVFEAAARATPVILSKSAGASELLKDKPGFMMVDPMSAQEIAEAILALAMNPVKMESMGAMAQETVKGMSWEGMYCSPVESLFKELLRD